MISIFILSIFGLVLLLKPRSAFFLYIFLYPLIPKYINIEIIPGSFYISHQTMMMFMLVIYTLLLISSKQLKVKNLTILKQWNVIYFLILFFIVKILSTIIYSVDKSGGIISILYYMIDSLVLLFVSAFYITKKSHVKQIIYVIVLSSFFVVLIALFEKYYGSNVFMEITDFRYDFYAKMLEGSFRNDQYRLMSTFNGNLILVSFLIAILPYMFYLYSKTNKIFSKIFILLFFLSSLLVLYWTYSRTVYLLLLFILFIYFLKNILKAIPKNAKKIFRQSLIFLILLIGFFILVNIDVIIDIMIGLSSSRSESASIDSRAVQYVVSWELVKENLLIGIGTVRNIVETYDQLIALDNYYIRIFIESGFLGLLLFILVLYKVVINSYRSITIECVKCIEFYILLSLILQVLNILLLSIPSNHMYIYINIYILMALNYFKNQNIYVKENT